MGTKEAETMREQAKKKEIADAQAVVAKSIRAEAFMKSDFWVLDLEPTIAKLQEDARRNLGWHPAQEKSLDQTALTNAYYSAVDQTIWEIFRKMNLMVSDGAEAEAYLKKSGENSK